MSVYVKWLFKIALLFFQIDIVQKQTTNSSVATRWQQQYEHMVIDADDLDERYKKVMAPLMYAQARLLDTHTYRAKALQQSASGSQRVRRIAKEVSRE